MNQPFQKYGFDSSQSDRNVRLRETFGMICTKSYIPNEDDTIKQVRSMSVILFIFMTGISFAYVSGEGCFTFIIYYFV